MSKAFEFGYFIVSALYGVGEATWWDEDGGKAGGRYFSDELI